MPERPGTRQRRKCESQIKRRDPGTESRGPAQPTCTLKLGLPPGVPPCDRFCCRALPQTAFRFLPVACVAAGPTQEPDRPRGWCPRRLFISDAAAADTHAGCKKMNCIES
eukprot:1807082-Pyramimonas_sp.AAC.1